MVARIIEEVRHRKQRYTLVDLLVQITTSARDDLFPFATTSECFEHLLILRAMYEMRERDQVASLSELARSTAIARPTVQKRLEELTERGALEPLSNGYAMRQDFFDSDFMVRGFRLRRVMVSIAAEKMADDAA